MPSKHQVDNEFPLTVRAGSTALKIYRDRKRSGDYFRLVYYLGGKRHRLNFKSLDAARREAFAKAAQLSRGDVDALQLNGKDRQIYGRALHALMPTGVALDAAATEYAQAARTLAGHSLLEAVNFYMRHGVNGVSGRMVSDAVTDFWQAKKASGRSAVYLKDIRYRTGGFSKAFNCEVRQLVAQDIADYLEGLKLSPRSFNNCRASLRTFFRFCVARGWLSKHADLLSRVERRSGSGGEIQIFTPGELRSFSLRPPRTWRRCLAFQAFAGVRTAELMRLTWHDLERRTGYIEITAKAAKTASRRLIPILPNLAAWLRVAPHNGNERLWPRSSNRYFAAQTQAASKAGICWKANGLRHSFISYRVALTKDIAACALESRQQRANDLRALPGALHRERSAGVVRDNARDRRGTKRPANDGMSETAADSYSQKLTECRLDPPGDPLIDGIREPYPFSSGFSTGEVCAKALGWQQELAARVRDYQERPDIPLEGKTEAAGLLVKLAAEAAMAVETLSLEFPEAFKAVAPSTELFPLTFQRSRRIMIRSSTGCQRLFNSVPSTN